MKYFQTDYYYRLDIGYFRDISSDKSKFWLEVPNDFDSSKIGVTRVYNVGLKNISASEIILNNLNWIWDGLFLGTQNALIKYELQYKRAVLYYLHKGLMNVGQHILYAMYAEKRDKIAIDVELQLVEKKYSW